MSTIICLDAGHGGSDPGAGGHGLSEKDLCLARVLRMKEIFLEEYRDVTVILTRSSDHFVELNERARIANNAGADVFISDHKNAFNGSARGFESYIFNGGVSQGTRDLQSTVHNKVVNELSGYGIPNRGTKQANFSVLRNTRMSALLLEEAFIDNKRDSELMVNDDFAEAYCRAVVEGVAEHLGLTKGSGNSNPAKPSTSKPSTPSNNNQATGPIADIQRTLNDRYNLNIAVDNLYGPETKRALIIALQTELNKQFGRGLTVDGIFGPKTRSAVVNVRQGASGNITYILQAILLCMGYDVGPIDGKFGPKTRSAVRSFQRDNNLVVDGIAGQQTFQMLFK